MNMFKPLRQEDFGCFFATFFSSIKQATMLVISAVTRDDKTALAANTPHIITVQYKSSRFSSSNVLKVK